MSRIPADLGPMIAHEPEAGAERVLLVDDEIPVLRLGHAVLARLGYEVTAVSDPVEALKLLEEGSVGFRVLVTDQLMPGISGLELGLAARRLSPDLPIVVATGYLDPGLERELESADIRHILLKPFGTQDLARIVSLAIRSVPSTDGFPALN